MSDKINLTNKKELDLFIQELIESERKKVRPSKIQELIESERKKVRPSKKFFTEFISALKDAGASAELIKRFTDLKDSETI